MSRLLTRLIYRGREPGPWGERIWLAFVGLAMVVGYVLVALLVTGVISLPFTIVGDLRGCGEGDGDGEARPQPGRSAATAAAAPLPPTASPTAAPRPTTAGGSTPTPTAAATAAASGTLTWMSPGGDLSFDYPAAYGRPRAAATRQDGVDRRVWTVSDGETTLLFAPLPGSGGDDRHERAGSNQPDDDARLWAELARIVGRPEAEAKRRGDEQAVPVYFFPWTEDLGGFGVETRGTHDGDPIIAHLAVYLSEARGLWVTGIAPRSETAGLYDALAVLEDSCSVHRKPSDTVIVATQELDTEGIRFGCPEQWTFRTRSVAGTNPGVITEGRWLASRWPRRVRPFGLVHVTGQRDAGSLGPQAMVAGVKRWQDHVERILGGEFTAAFGWESPQAISLRDSRVALRSPFRSERDGAVWRGEALWVFAGDRRVTLVLACPDAAYGWEHCLFEATFSSVIITKG